MKIVKPDEWGAAYKRYGNTTRAKFTKSATFHWNGPAVPTSTRLADESRFLRGVERYHLGRGWSGIAYNWLVGRSGRVYEGRGAGFRSAANGTRSGNDSSPSVFFVTGVGQPVTAAQKTSAVELVTFLVEVESIPAGAMPHSAWKATECPGDAVADVVDLVNAELAGNGSQKQRAAIRELQEALNSLRVHRHDGPIFDKPLVVDGLWGPKTKNGRDTVRAFYRARWLAAEAVVLDIDRLIGVYNANK